MKLVIKVGEATIEVEGENLKATRVAGSRIPVEVVVEKSRDEIAQEAMDRLAAKIREAAPRIANMCPGDRIEFTS